MSLTVPTSEVRKFVKSNDEIIGTRTVIQLASRYGFGSMGHIIDVAWALKALLDDGSWTVEQACSSTHMSDSYIKSYGNVSRDTFIDWAREYCSIDGGFVFDERI